MRGRGRGYRGGYTGSNQGRYGGPAHRPNQPRMSTAPKATNVSDEAFAYSALLLMMKNHPSGTKLKDLVKNLPSVGSWQETKKETNRALYKMQQDGLIDRTPENPPTWILLERGISKVNPGAPVIVGSSIPPISSSFVSGGLTVVSDQSMDKSGDVTVKLLALSDNDGNGDNTDSLLDVSDAEMVSQTGSFDMGSHPVIGTASYDSYELKVLNLVSAKQNEGMKLNDLINVLHTGSLDNRLETKKATNRALYKLQGDGLIDRTPENPPVWKLLDKGSSTASILNVATPGADGQPTMLLTAAKPVKASAYQATSSGSYDSFEVSVMNLILKNHPNGIKLNEIVNTLNTGGQSTRLDTKKSSNRALYKLQDDGMIKRTEENPPLWQFLEKGLETIQDLNDNPHNITSSFTAPALPLPSCATSVFGTPASMYFTPPSTPVMKRAGESGDLFEFSILNLILKRHPTGIKLNEIVNTLNPGGQSTRLDTKKSANRTLYKLQADGKIKRTEENPPLWQFSDKGLESVKTMSKTPSTFASPTPKLLEARAMFASPQQLAPAMFGTPQGNIQLIPGIDPGMPTAVFNIISRKHPQPVKSLQVKAEMSHMGQGGVIKKEINWALYSLQDKGLIHRTPENPPLWSLLDRGVELSKSVPLASSSSANLFQTPGVITPTLSMSPSNPGGLAGLTSLPSLMNASPSVQNQNAVAVINTYAQVNKLRIDYNQTFSGLDHAKRFVTILSLGHVMFPPAEAQNKKESKLRAAQIAYNLLVNRNPVMGGMSPFTGAAVEVGISTSAANKTPIQILQEYCQFNRLTLESEFSSQVGTDNVKKIQCTYIINEEEFQPEEGSTKQEAKELAAKMAVENLYKAGKLTGVQLPSSFVNALVLNNVTPEDRIANMVTSQFEQLLRQLPETDVGRKIFAGFVMSRDRDEPMDEDYDQVDAKRQKLETVKDWTVISVGSGNRCVTGDMLSMQGETVNDCHAEIIARRGFVRFLYSQLLVFLDDPNDPDNIFMKAVDEKIYVKPSVQFHLYISTAPCGDGALFAHSDMNQESAVNGPDGGIVHKPTMDNPKQGALRTKVENGEGCIPIDGGDNVPTWDGLLRGERLRTMSCSDKVMKWNILGLQGSLLSTVIEPVYMYSLTLGSLYHHGHLSRAICCRLDRFVDKLKESLPTNYKINHPKVGKVSGEEPTRHAVKVKTREFSLNWTCGDEKAEVLDGTKGRCEMRFGSPDPISQVCKRNLYQLYKMVVDKCGSKLQLDTSYTKTKHKATGYSLAQQVMKKSLEAEGCGRWMDKPVEADDFA